MELNVLVKTVRRAMRARDERAVKARLDVLARYIKAHPEHVTAWLQVTS